MWKNLKNRSWWWIIFSILVGFIPVTASQTILNTFYTVLGIIFGIGFSLIIFSIYREVGNSNDRGRMRSNVKNIREIFFFYFVVATICYSLSSLLTRLSVVSILDVLYSDWNHHVVIVWIINHFHLSMATLAVFVIVLATFLRNYISLQRLNEDVDEELAK